MRTGVRAKSSRMRVSQFPTRSMSDGPAAGGHASAGRFKVFEAAGLFKVVAADGRFMVFAADGRFKVFAADGRFMVFAAAGRCTGSASAGRFLGHSTGGRSMNSGAGAPGIAADGGSARDRRTGNAGEADMAGALLSGEPIAVNTMMGWRLRLSQHRNRNGYRWIHPH